jgi:hypothetical protein
VEVGIQIELGCNRETVFLVTIRFEVDRRTSFLLFFCIL